MTTTDEEQMNLVVTEAHSGSKDHEGYTKQDTFNSCETGITSTTYSNDSSTSMNTNMNNLTDIPYLSTKLPRELVACICIYFFGVYSPHYFIRSLIGHNMRPIPYQVLPKSGDVVLDLELNQELIEDVTVPGYILIRMSIYVPLFLLIVITQIAPVIPTTTHPPVKSALLKHYDTHSAACVLLTTVAFAEFTTQVAKMYVGRLRPNFYNLCKFDPLVLQCTADEDIVMEARSSFPSGHSSLSAAGMGVLVCFFLGRVNIQGRRGGNMFSKRIKVALAISPMAYSIFVACSRLVDNWHHPSDIVAGLCLGLFFPGIFYHSWYPSILSKNSGVPLSCSASSMTDRSD